MPRHRKASTKRRIMSSSSEEGDDDEQVGSQSRQSHSDQPRSIAGEAPSATHPDLKTSHGSFEVFTNVNPPDGFCPAGRQSNYLIIFAWSYLARYCREAHSQAMPLTGCATENERPPSRHSVCSMLGERVWCNSRPTRRLHTHSLLPLLSEMVGMYAELGGKRGTGFFKCFASMAPCQTGLCITHIWIKQQLVTRDEYTFRAGSSDQLSAVPD